MDSGQQTTTVAIVQHATGSPHANATALGIDASGWAALAAIGTITLLWKNSPSIGAWLDSRIAVISDRLAEMAALRTEAEALRTENAAKLKSADSDRAEMLAQAQRLGGEQRARAQAATEMLIERRRQSADAMMAQSESHALEVLRANAADAAARAAVRIFLERCDDANDARLFEEAMQQIKVSGLPPTAD